MLRARLLEVAAGGFVDTHEWTAPQVRDRLAFLKSEATDECIVYNKASERDLLEFLRIPGVSAIPSIFLLDNGNLRAVWKGPNGAHLALQFLGNRCVQFVIFAPRPETAEPARSTGRDSFAGIRKQIDAFGLAPLMSA